MGGEGKGIGDSREPRGSHFTNAIISMWSLVHWPEIEWPLDPFRFTLNIKLCMRFGKFWINLVFFEHSLNFFSLFSQLCTFILPVSVFWMKLFEMPPRFVVSLLSFANRICTKLVNLTSLFYLHLYSLTRKPKLWISLDHLSSGNNSRALLQSTTVI